MSAGAGGRDLGGYLSPGGYIAVDVTIRIPGIANGRTMGASATPKMVAGFLRDLADDVKQAGKDPS